MKLLAVDFGMRRSGLALADLPLRVITPAGRIEGPLKDQLTQLRRIIQSRGVQRVIFGLPLHSSVFQLKRIYKFAQGLAKAARVPVFYQDEHLTSFAAQHAFYPDKASQDELAAMMILEDYLGKA